MSLIGQMTEREKYRTRGNYFVNVAHNNEMAMEQYKALVTKYPSDFAGHNNLAVTYFAALNFAEARVEGRRALDLYPRSLKFQGNYALYAMYASDFTAGADVAREIVRKEPSYVLAYLPLAMEALAAGDIAGAKSVYKQVASTGGEGASLSAIGLADVAMVEGHPEEAVRVLPSAIQADQARKDAAGAAAKTIALAEAQSLLKQTAAAIKSVDDALQISADIQIVVPAARILLAAGQEQRASDLIKKLDDSIQPLNRAYARMLDGERLTALGRAGDAMDSLTRARSLADLWLVRFTTGVAYQRFNHHVEAVTELENCSSRIGEATAIFLDDVPTFRYTVPMRELLRRAQQGGAK
jgi:tetratricopeptide (TPR) repeat protein